VIERLNPDGLHPTSGYHHITRVEAQKLVFFAGQMPMDDSGTRVVGIADLDQQVDRTIVNITRALQAAGAPAHSVVRSVVYVVSDRPDDLGRVWHRLADSAAIGAAFESASTLIGVATLGFPDQLVEVDLTAALD
jgi:enamine deaminase RidA (YjgF/YER057c/UK114 family)